MAFNNEMRSEIEVYVNQHLPDEYWFENYFDYIKDTELSVRLADEFKAIRYIYKLLEGLQADDYLKIAQVRIQIIYYASIYEAVLHYILFDLLKDHPDVRALFVTKNYKRISVSKNLDDLIHDGKKIFTMYQADFERDINQIRFEYKVDVAIKLGLLTEDLGNELKKIYTLRNAIHLHAEIRKGIQYEIEMSLIAYRRMKIFREQIIEGMKNNGIL
jgi:hypothetical protein